MALVPSPYDPFEKCNVFVAYIYNLNAILIRAMPSKTDLP